jgi:hypothetical protein
MHRSIQGGKIRGREEAGITTCLPKPQASGNQAEGPFGSRDFRYLPGERLFRLIAA